MKTFYRSFAGGEITPELYGRLDLTKFQTGLRQALNFFVLPHGPAVRRTGTRHVAFSRITNNVRLIPFVFSATQAVIVELGYQYARFHTDSGTELETAKFCTTFTIADPGVFEVAAHGWSVGDTLYCATPLTPTFALNGQFFIVTNVTTDTFRLQNVDGGADISTLGLAVPGYITFARVYTLASPFNANHLPSLTFAQDSDVLTLTCQAKNIAARELRRAGPASWSFATVTFAATLAAPTGATATATMPTATNPTTQKYTITAVASNLVDESPYSSTASCSNNLTIAGNFNTITWTNNGAARYYVYKLRGGAWGFIGQATDGAVGVIDDNILPDVLITPPEASITLNNSSGNYPATTAYHERRRWFGGTTNEPQNVWATRNGTPSNLTSSVPAREDDALEFRIASNQQNTIRHLVPLTDIVALTSGGEFRIYADGGPAISPTTLAFKPQGFTGASEVQPVVATSAVLYVQAQGSRIRELAYDATGAGYRADVVDVSILAPHLFDGYTIVRLAFVRAPTPTLYALRSDGVLLAMTYVPDQQVFGWTQHTTNGFIQDIAVIPADEQDTLWLAVFRTTTEGGFTFIEKLTPRLIGTDATNAFFVDGGLTYSGVPTTTLRGLRHLEGLEVQALADGAVVEGLTVADGALTLPTAASVVHVGLAYNSDLVTLPLALEMPAAGQGMSKNPSKLYLRVVATSVLKAGPTFAKLRETPARTIDDVWGSPPALRTREVEVSIDPGWNQDGSVCLRQDKPLPATVAAMALEVATGG